MSFLPIPESTSYRDPDTGAFMTKGGMMRPDGEIEPFKPFNLDKIFSATNKAKQWQELSSGRQDYSQSGTDIPSYSEGAGGTFAAGSDFPAQGFGYRYQSPSAVAAGPSFDLNKPYIPGKQDYTGIPNATPEMLRRLQQRKMMNPGGQELPGFLKPV